MLVGPELGSSAGSSLVCACRGQYWASLRAGVQPMFHSASLATYDPVINTALDDLLRNLDAVAAQGQLVDMHRLLGNMTMQVGCPASEPSSLRVMGVLLEQVTASQVELALHAVFVRV